MRNIRKVIDNLLQIIPYELSGTRSELQRLAEDSKYYAPESNVPLLKLNDILKDIVGEVPDRMWKVKVASIITDIPVDTIISELQSKGVNIKDMLTRSKIKLWIARDAGIYDEDYELVEKGKLHIFYDTPLVDKDPNDGHTIFTCSRCIGEIPSYMYPEIKEGDCYQFNSDYLFYSGFKKL